MRRSIALAAAAALVASLALVTAAAGSGFWKAPPFSAIGIMTLGEIDASFTDFTAEDGTTVLSVWSETGSASNRCLATLNEAHDGVSLHDLYCSSRTVQFADGSWHSGVYLHLFLVAPPYADTAYWVNVYQEGAHFYGTPRKCDLTGCN